MFNSVAQTIALTNWGNSALRRGLDLNQEKFYPGNSVFACCREVRFADADPKTARGGVVDYAPNPVDWVKRLKDGQGRSLRLHYRPYSGTEQSDRIASGLGQGGRWFIEVVKVVASDYWEAQWVKIDGKDGGKDWEVVYKRVSANESVRPMEFHTSLEEINSRLEKSLAHAAEFARGHKFEKFAESFENGRKIVEESKAPLEGVPHPDILYPAHFSLKAQRTLGCIQAAWVFGGKGSWNDVRLDDGKDHDVYETLSDELYTQFCKAIVYAVNSGFLKD